MPAGQFRGSVRCACVGANGRTAVISQSAPRGVLCVSGASASERSTFTGAAAAGAKRPCSAPPERNSAPARPTTASRPATASTRRPRPASARSTSSLLPARHTLLGRPASAQTLHGRAADHDGLVRTYSTAAPDDLRIQARRQQARQPPPPTPIDHVWPQRAPLQAWGAPKEATDPLVVRPAVIYGGSAAPVPRHERPQSAGGGGGGAAVARPSRVWPRRADAEAAHAVEEEEGRVAREADAAREQRSELHATLEQMSERRRRDPGVRLHAALAAARATAPPRPPPAPPPDADDGDEPLEGSSVGASGSVVPVSSGPAGLTWGSFAPARSDSPPPPPDATLPLASHGPASFGAARPLLDFELDRLTDTATPPRAPRWRAAPELTLATSASVPSCGGAEGGQSWSDRYEPPTEYPTDEHAEEAMRRRSWARATPWRVDGRQRGARGSILRASRPVSRRAALTKAPNRSDVLPSDSLASEGEFRLPTNWRSRRGAESKGVGDALITRATLNKRMASGADDEAAAVEGGAETAADAASAAVTAAAASALAEAASGAAAAPPAGGVVRGGDATIEEITLSGSVAATTGAAAEAAAEEGGGGSGGEAAGASAAASAQSALLELSASGPADGGPADGGPAGGGGGGGGAAAAPAAAGAGWGSACGSPLPSTAGGGGAQSPLWVPPSPALGNWDNDTPRGRGAASPPPRESPRRAGAWGPPSTPRGLLRSSSAPQQLYKRGRRGLTMTPQTLGALREGVVVQGAAAHASAAALSVTSKANARAELAVLGAAAAPIRRGSKVWRGAARKA